MSTAPVSFTRPANTTAYASGDLVADSATGASVVPLALSPAIAAGGDVAVNRVRLQKSTAGVTNAAFRLHFYRTAPVAANGDNGIWLTTGAAGYLGSVDVTIDKAMSDGAVGYGAPAANAEVAFNRSGAVYALLEARGAYTPASAEVFTVEVDFRPVR